MNVILKPHYLRRLWKKVINRLENELITFQWEDFRSQTENFTYSVTFTLFPRGYTRIELRFTSVHFKKIILIS